VLRAGVSRLSILEVAGSSPAFRSSGVERRKPPVRAHMTAARPSSPTDG
jgi:hypothetical protein